MRDDRERTVTRTHTVTMKARPTVLRPESRNAVALRRTAVVLLLVIVFIAAVFLMRPGANQAAYSSPSPQMGMTVDNSHVHTSKIPSEAERKTVLLLTEGLHGRCADIIMDISCTECRVILKSSQCRIVSLDSKAGLLPGARVLTLVYVVHATNSTTWCPREAHG